MLNGFFSTFKQVLLKTKQKTLKCMIFFLCALRVTHRLSTGYQVLAGTELVNTALDNKNIQSCQHHIEMLQHFK